MNQEIKELVNIRPGKIEDKNFILATWLRGLYYGNSWFKEIDKDSFMRHYHDIVMAILTKPSTAVAVVALKDDENVILGYSVCSILGDERDDHSYPILHWVFVKETWRRVGLGRALVPENAIITTHMTAIGKKLKPPSMKFNPWAI